MPSRINNWVFRFINSCLVALLLAAGTSRADYTFQNIDDPNAATSQTSPAGVSNGNVAGFYSDESNTDHGFLFDGSNYITIDFNVSGGNTLVLGIDGANLVGHALDTNFHAHPFLYNGKFATPSFTIPGAAANTTGFTGISGNNIVGIFADKSFNNHGFFYNGTSHTVTVLNDPLASVTGGTFPQAVDGTTVVGFYYTYTNGNPTSHGFIWNGTFTTVDNPNAGNIGTTLNGIANGTAVGYYNDNSTLPHSFLYSDGNFTDFDVTNATFTQATGIDADGDVVGTYAGLDGTHGFLATPAPSPANITTSPSDLNGFTQSTSSFSIVASGLPQPTIQWQISTDSGNTWTNITGNISGAAIAGFNSATLTLTNAPLSLNGSMFRAFVSNSGGNATSDPATLSLTTGLGTSKIQTLVNNARGVAALDGNIYVLTGQPVVLSEPASGSGSLSYQWLFNGKPIAKATSSVYTIAKFAKANAGNYTVTVSSNVDGVAPVTRGPAGFGLGVAPKLGSQPANNGVVSGNDATFITFATGTPAPDFVWSQSFDNGATWTTLHDGANFSNSSSSTLTVHTILSYNGTLFRAQAVSDVGVSAVSRNATLNVYSAGIVAGSISDSLSGNQSISGTTYPLAGQSVTLSVNATGPGTLVYQWELNGKAISKATSSSYTITKFAAANAGNYTVIIGTAALPGGAITVGPESLGLGTVPKFTAAPANMTEVAGQAATFTITPSANPLGGIKWQVSTDNGAHWSDVVNGTIYDNVTTPALVVLSPTTDMSGYQYRAVANNLFNTAVSKAATLTVTPPPLASNLQGNYKISSMLLAIQGVPGTSALDVSSAAQKYSVPVSTKGLAGITNAVADKIVTLIGTGSNVTLNITSATDKTFAATIYGLLDYTASESETKITIPKTAPGTISATLSDSSVLTVTVNVTGSVNINGTSIGNLTATITITLNKS